MKNSKRLLTVFFVFVFVLTSFLTANASSYLTSDGYYFWMEDNEAVAIHGCNSEKTELIFPVMLGNAFITSIDENAFLQNKTIRSVEFAQLSHITRIGDGAFYGCTGINTIVLPQQLKKVSDSVFQNCTSLNSVELGSNIESIDVQAFYNCRSLQTINLPDSLTSIDKLAFAECQSLTYLEIPKSVTSIAASSFHNDQNLTLGVYYDSYAFQFAKENGIPYVLIDNVILGDANLDGNLNINDVTAIQRHTAEYQVFNELQKKAGDTNGDGNISIDDATLIQSFFAEFDVPFQIGQTVK